MDYDMDVDSSTDNSKKPKIIKSGCNINNYIDTGVVAEKFIQDYYTALSTNNIQSLIDNNTLQEYTTIKMNTDAMKGDKIIPFLNNFVNYKIDMTNYNYVDSGSRRIDISVIGKLSNKSENLNFNQTFIICHKDDYWYIKNSIFIIF